jgi:hypothetical protein
MSRFDHSWSRINRPTRHPNLNPIRRLFGLRWKQARPSLDDFDTLANWITAILMVGLLLATYGFVDERDAKVAAQVQAEQSSKSLVHLLTGGTLTNPEMTVAVKCAQVMDVTN